MVNATGKTKSKMRQLFSKVLGLAFLALALLLRPTFARAQSVPAIPTNKPANQTQVPEEYFKSSISFEANHNASDSPVKFVSHGRGYGLYLTATEAVFAFRNSASGASCKPLPSVESSNGPKKNGTIAIEWLGANPNATLEGAQQLAAKVNHFTGANPAQWRTDVPLYGKVTQKSLYPGVDLVYYGNQRQFEFDFIVAPGADPKLIRTRYRGADSVTIGAGGELLLATAAGRISQPAPHIYQQVNSERKMIDGGYVLLGEREVGFSLGAYDPNLPLVIDPIVQILGIDGNCGGIAVDSSGNIFVTGVTVSTDFPRSSNAFDTLLNNNGELGSTDIFVTKLNPALSGSAQLVYSTYLGGSGDETAAGIAVDSAGNIFVTGTTASNNFPTSPNARDNLLNLNNEIGPLDVFVTKLNPSLSGNAQLVYSTYLGGSADDTAAGIAVDAAGNIFVTGTTASNNFPVSNNAFDTLINNNGNTGPLDVFVTKLNPSLSGNAQLVYSTYLGGNADETAAGIAVDATGNIFVTGTTASNNFPVSNNAFDMLINNNGNTGPLDVFVTKLNPSLSGNAQLVYSTYLGGNADETAAGIAVDATGNIFVTGTTASNNFPTSANARDNLLNLNNETGPLDVFVTKLNPSLSGTAQLVYSTYLGGNADETAAGIAVDAAGNIFVTGTTASNNFPVSSNARDNLLNNNGETGSLDVFVTKLNPAAASTAQLVYSTYLGGSADDIAVGIAVDSSGNIFVTGTTGSNDFPTSSNARDNLLNNNGETGPHDAFVTKLNPAASVSNQLVYSTFLGGSGDESCFVEPEIFSFNPTSGPVGSTVTIMGAGLSRAKTVVFNSTAASAFTVNSDSQITATVPANATSGKIAVTTAGGTALSASNFTVTLPSVSVTASIATASEGGAAGRFTVSRNGSTASALTVNYAVSGTATNGVDYTSLPGSVAIPAGSSSANIAVMAIDDALNENSETVVLQVIAGAGYTPGPSSSATVTILDNDPLPSLSINSVSVIEGGTATFTVTLFPASGRTVTVNFATSSGTAGAGLVCANSANSDYLPQSGTRTFAPGMTTQTINITVCTDSVTEPNETFFVNLSSPQNALAPSRTSVGTATILGSSKTGTFSIAPSNAEIAPKKPLTYALTWTVPEPENWHQLKNLDVRIRDGNQIALWLRFDEASNTFALFNSAAGKFGPSVAPGSPQALQSPLATLEMANTSVIGSGPTGPSVTLNLALKFKEPALGKTFIVEVAAADDLGNSEAFIQTGTVTVGK